MNRDLLGIMTPKTTQIVGPPHSSGGSWCRGREARRREMRLETGHAGGADTGVMRRPGRQVEAIADLERDGAAARDAERDRPGDDCDHLVVAVLVSGVPIARAVRPRRRVE